jgi:hexokinase
MGKPIGQSFRSYLKKVRGIDYPIAVANDSVCLLLGAGNTRLAGVVGTGLNVAYWEHASAIAPSLLAPSEQRNGGTMVAVNLEAGNFDGFPSSPLVKIVDQRSDRPGQSLAEKEAAGAYLYQLFNAAREAIGDTNIPLLSSTDQINDMITRAFVFPKATSRAAKTTAYVIADRLIHRSAQITAIELAGVLRTIKHTHGVLPIVMEGSVFWKARHYPLLVTRYLHAILPSLIPSFARPFGSSRRGIAILAMEAS